MEMDMQSPVIESRSHQGFGSAVISFFLKLILMVFLTVDMTGVMVYLLYVKKFTWLATIPIILASFSGLAAGILSRLFFFTMPRFVRWFFSCWGVIGTLAVAGLAGQRWLQIDLTGIRSATVNNDFLILSIIGWVSAFLPVFAWSSKSQPSSRQEPEPEVEMMPMAPYQVPYDPIMDAAPTPVLAPVVAITSRPVVRTRNTTSNIRWRKLKKRVLKSWKAFVKPGKRSHGLPILSIFVPRSPARRSDRQSSNRLQIRVPEFRSSLPAPFPVKTPRRQSGRRHHKTVRFIGKEEMRCPYCLQDVNPRDPKGIVVCPICHTAHHKECWDITGFCQVPHNHAVL
jgi:hypothetical protein